MKWIGKIHYRSATKEMEAALEQYIAAYEKEHGTIKIEEEPYGSSSFLCILCGLCSVFRLPPVPQLADSLSHGPHGTEGAPAPGFIEHHHNQPNQQGGQHHAVEPKAVLGHPVRHCARCVGPVPGHPEGPEQLHRLPQ